MMLSVVLTNVDFAAVDDTGASQTDNVTSQTSGLTISGDAESGSTIIFYDDANNNGVRDGSEVVLGTVVAVGGAFSTDIALAEGVYYVRVFQTDFVGNVSGSLIVLNLTIDTTL